MESAETSVKSAGVSAKSAGISTSLLFRLEILAGNCGTYAAPLRTDVRRPCGC